MEQGSRLGAKRGGKEGRRGGQQGTMMRVSKGDHHTLSFPTLVIDFHPFLTVLRCPRQGRYWDLIARGHDLESMLASSATAAAAASPSPSHDETERQGEHGHHADIGVAAAAAGGASGVGDEQHASYHQLHASDEEGMEGEPLLAMEEQGVGEEVREEGQERGKLMKEEERITGAVKAKVYKYEGGRGRERGGGGREREWRKGFEDREFWRLLWAL